jgi:NADH dehydrogenase FAD-containing subunit
MTGGRLQVAVVGGGVGGLETCAALRARAEGRVTVTLVSASPDFHWRAMDADPAFGLGVPERVPLADLTRELGVARLVIDRVAAVHLDGRALRLGRDGSVAFDVAVLAPGSRGGGPPRTATCLERTQVAEELPDAVQALREGDATSLLVVVPPSARWTLAAYETALLAAAATRAEVAVATWEDAPLQVFGARAADAVQRRLRATGVELLTGRHWRAVDATRARTGRRELRAGRVLELPVARGPRLPGVPSDGDGFVLTNADGAVLGSQGRVLAVGDAVAGALPHGGLAAASADRAAARVAELAGVPLRAPVSPPRVRAVLRTPQGPLFLQVDPADPAGSSLATTQALWWPPAKVAAPWLSALLWDRAVHHAGPPAAALA